MSKFYTRTGDKGTSGLLGDARVPKNHPRLEAVGAIDEASAVLGIVRAHLESDKNKEILITIQRDLYHMMAEVASTSENAARFRIIDQNRVLWLEKQVEIIGDQIQMPREFIVPGDTISGSFLDFARTVIRRAERLVSALVLNTDLDNEQILPYLNRLSTFCFVLELWEAKQNDTTISLAKKVRNDRDLD